MKTIWTRTTTTPSSPEGTDACSGMQILRRTAYAAAPWKNGGGTTHEAIRVPPAGDPFRWRVSIANVDTAGDFSDFSGYHRTLVLLEGSGVTLDIGDGHRVGLREAGDLVQFDGATAVRCTLVAGPCADLNLIVSQSLPPAQAWVAPLREPHLFQASATSTLLLVPVTGGLKVVSAQGESTCLCAGDLVVLAPNGAHTARFEPADATAPTLVFFARVGDTRRA